ncbi:MAG TPA: thymidine phosphorylase [Candidatus Fimicola cottocaccae]|nr:thymidine phosphorylase [Candidatus Fimicola cottocaccae]
MKILDLIIKKRDGMKLSKEEIDFFVKGVTDGTIPDYQTSAMLMAIYFRGLDDDETALLTIAMAHSGKVFDLSEINGIKVDKHSTGGVADTTTLILAPLTASVGLPIVKMSGKGLGFSGGTQDKLNSIPGFNVDIDENHAIEYAKKTNIVLMSQNNELTPADKKLYELRDVTGTVESLPLIASSIMSKKIAAGADAIVLDVKCGSGAFMKDIDSAKKLANIMVSIGKNSGRNVRAIITSMSQPLGNYIGNSLEVIEAIEVLKGNVKGDLLDVTLKLGAHMLILANITDKEDTAIKILKENIENKKGLEKFREMIIQQDGNPNIIDDYSLLPHCEHEYKVISEYSGYITETNTALIGRASLETGAGRSYKEQELDYGAGIIMKKRIGDKIEKGETIALIYSSSVEKCASAGEFIKKAIKIEKDKKEIPPLILDTII